MDFSEACLESNPLILQWYILQSQTLKLGTEFLILVSIDFTTVDLFLGCDVVGGKVLGSDGGVPLVGSTELELHPLVHNLLDPKLSGGLGLTNEPRNYFLDFLISFYFEYPGKQTPVDVYHRICLLLDNTQH